MMVRRRQQGCVRGARRIRVGLECLEDRLVPAPVQFFVVDTDSSLAVSGGITTPINAPIQQQGPGSLSTTYSGTINTDIVAGSSIRFDQAGTDLVAANSGNWQPGPTGSIVNPPPPANYGMSLNLFGLARIAIRGAVLTAFTAAPQTLTEVVPGIYTFPATQSMAITAGTSALNHPLGSFSGTLSGDPLSNTSPDPGYLIDFGPLGVPGFFIVYVPVRLSLSVNIPNPPVSASLNITGAILGVGFSVEPFEGGKDRASLTGLSYLAVLSLNVSPAAAPAGVPASTESVPVQSGPTLLMWGQEQLAPTDVSAVAAPSQAVVSDAVFADALWQFGAI